MSVRADLSPYVDTSSAAAIVATTSALTEIALWVDQTDSLTIRHVIKNHISPSKTGVDLGPYSEDEFRDIVETAWEDTKERRQAKWDKKKTYINWVLSAIGLLVAIGGSVIAYLKFVTP